MQRFHLTWTSLCATIAPSLLELNIKGWGERYILHLHSPRLFVFLNYSTIILIVTISDALTVSLHELDINRYDFKGPILYLYLFKIIILDATSSYNICYDHALPPWTHCTQWNDFTHLLSPSALIPTVQLLYILHIMQ